MQIYRSVITVFFIVLLVACGNGESDDDGGSGSGSVQIINSMLDSPEIIVRVMKDDDTISTTDVSYQETTGVDSLDLGNYAVLLEYQNPLDNSLTTVYSEYDFSVVEDKVLTIIISGEFSSPQFHELEKNSSDSFSDDEEVEEFELEVINLASDSTEVYLEGQLDNSGAPLVSLTPGSFSDPVILEDYDNSSYRFLVEDGSGEVYFDSGKIDFDENSRSLLIITDSAGPDSSKKSAYLVDSTGVDVYVNEEVGSYLRLVNLIPDDEKSNVDISYSATSEAVSEDLLAFGELKNKGLIETGFVDVAASSDSDSLLSKTSAVSLSNDAYETVVVGGRWGDSTVAIGSLSGKLRPLAKVANIQFFSGLIETDDDDIDEVDLYAIEIGGSLSAEIPICVDVGYMSGCTTTLSATTSYDVVVTTSGTNLIIAGPVRLTPEELSTILLLAAESEGGGEPYSIYVETLSEEE